MSLEQQLERFNDNFEKWMKMGGPNAAKPTKSTKEAEPASTGTKKPTKGKAKVDLAAVKAVCEKYRELTDKATCIKLLKKVGKVGSTAELDEKYYGPVITAMTAAIKEAEKKAEEDEDEDEEDEEDEEEDEDEDEDDDED